MRTIVFALLFACVVAFAASADLLDLEANATPPRPRISETFSAETSLSIVATGGIKAHGSGVWAADQSEGKALEEMKFDIAAFDSRILYRYDMHREFNVMGKNCTTVNVTGSLIPAWSWVELAKYDGEKSIDGHKYETWGFKLGVAELGVAVSSSHRDTPVYFFTFSSVTNITVKFSKWSTHKPSSSLFDVPKECPKNPREAAYNFVPNAPGCVSRSTMIARAEVWVNNRVPYNQGGRYQGYREDCSGYVSMAWETSQPGYVTSTLPQISHPINKGDLQPGDVLLCTSEHVVLFGGWADGSQSHYVAFEETRPGEGTVKRVTPYPYWYNTGCFKPYRYNAVC